MHSDGYNVAGRVFPRGTAGYTAVPITTMLDGTRLALHIHVFHGRVSGPTLVLLSTLHGDEWFALPALRAVAARIDVANLRGTLVIVPVANPPALRLQTRNIRDGSDSPDMNRSFPGSLGWVGEQLTKAVTEHALSGANALLDLHMGSWGSAFRDILIADDLADESLIDESERLALAFGSPIIRRAKVVSGFPGPRSSIGYAGAVLGIPALGVEVGGPGFGSSLETRWLDATVDGVLAVMGALDMVDDPPSPGPERQLIYRKSIRVNPRVGGMLRSAFGGEALGAAVERGTLLGTVVSPYTFEVLEELRAPVSGSLFYTARDHPVHPGSWAYGLADTEDPGARWIDGVPGWQREVSR